MVFYISMSYDLFVITHRFDNYYVVGCARFSYLNLAVVLDFKS